VDDTLYRKARVFAASTDTSVSALVREFLNQLTHCPDGNTEKKSVSSHVLEVINTIRSRHPDFDANMRISRDELHSR
jgi:hypothetical protein